MSVAAAVLASLVLSYVASYGPSAQAAAPGSQNLSSSVGFSGKPAIARSGDATYVAWLELGGFAGYRVRRLTDTGGSSGSNILASGSGFIDLWHPQIAVSGDNVHVTWEQANRDSGYHGIWVASSSNGGASWARRMISGGGANCCPDVAARPDGGWAPRIAASGDLAAVTYVNQAGDVRLWTGGVNDDGSNRLVSSTTGGQYADAWDVAMEGTSTYVAVRSSSGALNVHRYEGADATTGASAFGVDGGMTGIGTPRIAVSGDRVFVAYQTGDLWQVGSDDRGATFTAPSQVSDASSPCRYGCSGMDLSASGTRANAIWSGPAGLFERGFGVSGMGPVNSVVPDPEASGTVSSTAKGVVVAFAAGPDGWRQDVYAGVRRVGQSEFTIRNLSGSPDFASFSPEVAAQGDFFGVTWREWESASYDTNGLEVFYNSGSLDPPDLTILDSEVVQAIYGADKLVKNKPGLIRVLVRSTLTTRMNVPIEVSLNDGGVETTSVYGVSIAPGAKYVFLPKPEVIRPQGPDFTYSVVVDPAGVIDEFDETNNSDTDTYVVKDTRPFKALVVPIQITGAGGGQPTEEEIQTMAEGTSEFIKAAFPLDPDEVEIVAQTATPLKVANGNKDSLAIKDEIIFPLDAMNPSNTYDSVMGVPPEAWLRTHFTENDKALGLAFSRYTTAEKVFKPTMFFGVPKSVILDPIGHGGWEAAHELAHQLGWVYDGHLHEDLPGNKAHLVSTPAPGMWVKHRYEIRDKVDWMFNSTEGADVRAPTDRWLSNHTWDFLLQRFAIDPIDPASIRISGSIDAGGIVTSGSWYEVEGILDASLGDAGSVTVRYLDGTGALLEETGFDPANSSSSNPHAVTDLGFEAFSATIPDVNGTQEIELVDSGGNVLYSRTRSANTPVTEVFPDGGETFAVGDTMTVRWVASDADVGDTLSHVISLSLDNGASWRPLAGGVTGDRIDVKLTGDFETEEALVRVETSDGWNTTSDVSDSTFRIVNAAQAEKIVYGTASASGYALFTIEPDGSNKTQITPTPTTSGGGWRDPAWSPDGQQIVAVTGNPNQFKGELWILEEGVGGVWAPVHQLTSPTYNDSDPEWSPDGTKIVFSRTVGAPTYDQVGIIDVNGNPGDEVLFAGRGQDPTWHPNGTKIAFDRVGDIYSVNIDGTNEQQLSFEAFYGDATIEPAWSPDGNWIAVVFYRTAGGTRYGELGLVRVSNGAVYDVTGFRARDFTRPNLAAPEWGPDGRTVAFVDQFGGSVNGNIMTINAGQVIDRILGGFYSYGDPATDVPNACCGIYFKMSWLEGREAAPVPPPDFPVADAGGPYSVDEGGTVQLDASGSDVPNGPGTYGWDLDGDGVYDDASGQTATFDAPDDDYNSAGLAVTDFFGVIDTEQVTIDVRNLAPVLSGVTATIDASNVGVLNATYTDAGLEDTHSATVDWGDGSPLEDATILGGSGGGSLAATHTYATSGNYTVTLTVTDDDGGTDAENQSVVVLPANQAPVAQDATASTDESTPVEVPLSYSDADEGPFEMQLEIDQAPEHGNVFLQTASGGDARDVVALYIPFDGYAGTDTFSYRANDGEDRSGPGVVTVTVVGDAPAPSPTPTPTPTPSETGGGSTGGQQVVVPTPTPTVSPSPIEPTPTPTPTPPEEPRCTILGTALDDVLRGTAADDVICGRGGDDRLVGRGGDDVIEGSRGNDLIFGGVGADQLRGGDGLDVLIGGAGRDSLRGRAGDDRLIGGPGRDFLSGGPGRDLCVPDPGMQPVKC